MVMKASGPKSTIKDHIKFDIFTLRMSWAYIVHCSILKDVVHAAIAPRSAGGVPNQAFPRTKVVALGFSSPPNTLHALSEIARSDCPTHIETLRIPPLWHDIDNRHYHRQCLLIFPRPASSTSEPNIPNTYTYHITEWTRSEHRLRSSRTRT